MNNINIAVLWLLDPVTRTVLTGGMERWCRDLALLVESRGYRATIYQKSHAFFEHQFSRAVTIRGVKASPAFRGNWTLSRYLAQNCDATEPFIFVSQELALSSVLRRAVGVNHGIFWNGDLPYYKRMLNKHLQRRLIDNLTGVICVDSNYINWCHAEVPGRKRWRDRLYYVPNYADIGLFGQPALNTGRLKDGRLNILFPRRMSGTNIADHGRGVGFLLTAVKILEERGLNVRVVCAGRGNLQEQVAAWAAENGLRCLVESVEVALDQMPLLYSQCDVVVVPSLEHEGTSLAAIEGLLSGKPTVVTHIGGLPNIVIDGLNGYVCDLRPESLAARLMEIAISGGQIDRSVVAGCAAALGKGRWESQVWSVLQTCLNVN